MNKLMFAGLALAAVLAVNVGTAHAAESAAQKVCAAEWDAMKTANKIPAGTTWPTFEKDCMAKAAAAPAALAMAPATKIAAPAMAPPAKMAAPAMAPAAKMAAPAAPVASAADNEKNCADQWAQMKTLKKVLSGATWDTFKVDCMAKLQAASTASAPAAPATAPAAKMAAPAAPAMAPAAKMAAPDTKVAAPIGGTSGEQSRIKTCAAEWDKMKAANKVPTGMTWPLFWHDCDTKLKAAGQ